MLSRLSVRGHEPVTSATLIPTKEVLQLSQEKNRLTAVRMYDKAVKMSIETAGRMSGMAHGRLAADLRKYVGLLKRLGRDDPEHVFWETLQRAVLKLTTFLHRIIR